MSKYEPKYLTRKYPCTRCSCATHPDELIIFGLGGWKLKTKICLRCCEELNVLAKVRREVNQRRAA